MNKYYLRRAFNVAHHSMRSSILSIIDFFYPPFRRIMPLQTFRYAVCGGGNALLGLVTFYIGFYHIFNQQYFDLGFLVLEPYSAALLVSSTITFIIGFVLNKYVVFSASYLKGRVQLFRYFLSFYSNLAINYGMLKLLVGAFHWNAMLSQILTTCVVIAISYVTQRYFTFRI